MASDVFRIIENEHVSLIKRYRDLIQERGKVAVEGVRIPNAGKAELVNDMLTSGVRFTKARGNSEIVETRSIEQAKLLMKLIELGEGGRNHFIPIDDEELAVQLKLLTRHIKNRRDTVEDLVNSRTSDPEIGRKAFDLVLGRF